MTEKSKTIAVAGSSPFALLLTGLLAADHSRAVVLVTDPPNPYRLARSIPLSVAPVTRPETWALVRANARRTLKRLNRLAPGAVERVDPVMLAHDRSTGDGLRHVHHLAAGFGFAVERPPGLVEAPGSAIMIRDCHRISETAVREAALRWLKTLGARVIYDSSRLTLRRNGAGMLDEAGIDHVVLADDDAIRTFVPAGEIAAFSRTQAMRSILTAPIPGLAHPLTLHVDRGVTISQRQDGALEILAPDVNGGALDLIAECLPPNVRPRLAAQLEFMDLVTHDGAPVIGATPGNGAYVVAGLGELGMMLAPVVAHGILGKARRNESAWLDARQPNVEAQRAGISDLHATVGEDILP